jgi:phosphoglucosamine mutase
VRESGAHLGIALDGDADRAILVDERGEVVDGDVVMALLASRLQECGELRHGTLVATVMSNLGLHVAMRDRGIRMVTTPVGDRYVVEEMLRGGYNLGGEQSGHIVFLDHNTTGDGLITGLAVLALLVETGRALSELRQIMQRFPQVLENLRVTSKPDVASLPAVAAAIGHAERELGERGRVLVRYSGTEPLLRVMVEGEREPTIRKLAHDIVDAARAAIGA